VSRPLSAEPDLPEDADGELPEHDGDVDGGATITPYRDGPLIVRGDFRLLDQDGAEIDPGRKTVALCRCGKSRMRPFCDGTHQVIRFRAPSKAEQGREPPPDPARFVRGA
jgi:CDGSH-type Zn-finger protein